MGLNFHIGNCGVQIEVSALSIERAEGTNALNLMEWNLTWLKPNNLKLMEWNFDLAKTQWYLRCMQWTLT